MKKLFAVLIVLIMAFGCVEEPVNGNGNETNITPDEGPVVEYGDNVSVDYVLSVEGEVIDTSMASVADASGILDPRRIYIPLKFEVLYDHRVINGFVDAVIGMKVNETKNVTISPERGYGEYKPNLKYLIPKFYNKSMIESVPISYFEERNISFSNGTAFDTEFGRVFVEDFNDTHVEIAYMLEQGDTFTVNGLPQKVVDFDTQNLVYAIEYDVKIDKTYYALSPISLQPALIRIVNITDTFITMDENHVLAGKTLDYEITLLNED